MVIVNSLLSIFLTEFRVLRIPVHRMTGYGIITFLPKRIQRCLGIMLLATLFVTVSINIYPTEAELFSEDNVTFFWEGRGVTVSFPSIVLDDWSWGPISYRHWLECKARLKVNSITYLDCLVYSGKRGATPNVIDFKVRASAAICKEYVKICIFGHCWTRNLGAHKIKPYRVSVDLWIALKEGKKIPPLAEVYDVRPYGYVYGPVSGMYEYSVSVGAGGSVSQSLPGGRTVTIECSFEVKFGQREYKRLIAIFDIDDRLVGLQREGSDINIYPGIVFLWDRYVTGMGSIDIEILRLPFDDFVSNFQAIIVTRNEIASRYSSNVFYLVPIVAATYYSEVGGKGVEFGVQIAFILGDDAEVKGADAPNILLVRVKSANLES